MGILEELLKDVPIPKVAKVRQVFDSENSKTQKANFASSWVWINLRVRSNPVQKWPLQWGAGASTRSPNLLPSL